MDAFKKELKGMQTIINRAKVLCTTKYKNNSRNRSKYEHCSPHKI